MKQKKLAIITFLGACLLLSACGRAGKNAVSSHSVGKADLTIVFGKNKSVKFDNLPIAKNEKVLTLLKKHEKLAETGGFITKIAGVSQNAAKKQYWMYKVNGQLASKGAAQQAIKAGDKIEFYLGD